MKIIIGKLGLETNTFSSEKGTFEYWSKQGFYQGEDMIARLKGKTDYLSAMMDAADALGVEVIPTIGMLDAGPTATREALDQALGMMLDMIKAHQDEADALCLALHGAGCAEGIDDLETYTLRKIREVVGYGKKIMYTLDLHANMTKEMVALGDGIFGIKYYPHTDQYEAGYRAFSTLVKCLREDKDIYTSMVKLPMLICCSAGNTISGPMKAFEAYVRNYKEAHGLIDATLFHGFPFADTPCTGASIVTVSEVSQEDADWCAEELADVVWKRREELRVPVLDAEEAIAEAKKTVNEKRGYVVINEASDNPGGAATCDATGLLKALIAHQEVHSILGYIHDPEIAAAAFAAGVGGKVSGLLGAKKDKLHGTPVILKDAYVAALSDGKTVGNNIMVRGIPADYGRTARLVIGNCEVVVTERLVQQTFDDTPFTVAGANLESYDIVAVKSCIHFRAWFEERAAAIIGTSTEGIHTDRLETLPYQRIPRPIWPLDPM